MAIITVTETNSDGQGNETVITRQVEVPDELINLRALRAKGPAALANNATYLALANPTAAQTASQVKALTRQVNALVRITIGLLDSVADT